MNGSWGVHFNHKKEKQCIRLFLRLLERKGQHESSLFLQQLLHIYSQELASVTNEPANDILIQMRGADIHSFVKTVSEKRFYQHEIVTGKNEDGELENGPTVPWSKAWYELEETQEMMDAYFRGKKSVGHARADPFDFKEEVTAVSKGVYWEICVALDLVYPRMQEKLFRVFKKDGKTKVPLKQLTDEQKTAHAQIQKWCLIKDEKEELFKVNDGGFRLWEK